MCNEILNRILGSLCTRSQLEYMHILTYHLRHIHANTEHNRTHKSHYLFQSWFIFIKINKYLHFFFLFKIAFFYREVNRRRRDHVKNSNLNKENATRLISVCYLLGYTAYYRGQLCWWVISEIGNVIGIRWIIGLESQTKDKCFSKNRFKNRFKWISFIS